MCVLLDGCLPKDQIGWIEIVTWLHPLLHSLSRLANVAMSGA